MRTNTPPHIYDDKDDQLVIGDDMDEVADPYDEQPPSDEELQYVGELDDVLAAWDAEVAEARADANLTLFRPTQDDSKLTFSKHKGIVFCVALNPEGTLAVSGGEDDKAFVWNVENGDVVHEITGHTDSVTAVGFNYDGTYLATGDMAGFIQVFKVSQQYKLNWSFTGEDMCWMKWHFASNVLMAGMESGDIYVWRVPQSDCKILKGFGEKCDAATLTNDGRKLAAGYGNGHFKIWDIRTENTILNSPPNEYSGHSANITCVAGDRDSQLVITGSEDGRANIFGPQGHLCTLAPEDDTVEAVLIDCPDFELKLAVTATVNGTVSVWDIARKSLRLVCEGQEGIGITKLVWGKHCTIIGATLDGFIKIWDVRSGALKHQLQGHVGHIMDIVFHMEKDLVVASSQDGTCKVFQIPEL